MRNILIILGGIAVLAVAALAVYQWQGEPRPTGTPVGTPARQAAPGATPDEIARANAVAADDFTLGKADAPVTVIEYASLTCPHCADFHVNVLPRIKAAYIDTGKVRMVFRDFPLDQAALAASVVARCAGPERHFAMIDLLFKRQQSWAATADPIAAMVKLAGLAGMTDADVKACFGKEDIEKAVLEQRLLSEKVFDIEATPSFIINGAKHTGGITFNEFKAAADPLIAKAAK